MSLGTATRRSLPLLGAKGLAPGREPQLPPRSVRVSVTDRCDFACTYCRPSRSDGYVERRLPAGAWRAMLGALREAGVRRVRFTGGEPLLHPQIVELVAEAAAAGFQDLALTTNASQLARLARPLRDAGLSRINVSIDTLDAARFRALTRGGELAPVLAGLEAARAVGLSPVKLNTVVLRGENDDELEALTRWAWEHAYVPRFLEVMPIAEGEKLARTSLVPASEMRARLAHLLVDEDAVTEPELGPARYVRALHDPSRRVGFITGTTDTFCETCDRLRVSTTGTLRPCLATDVGVEAGEEARAGDRGALLARIAEAWTLKPDGTTWKGCTEPTAAKVSMRAIGG